MEDSERKDHLRASNAWGRAVESICREVVIKDASSRSSTSSSSSSSRSSSSSSSSSKNDHIKQQQR